MVIGTLAGLYGAVSVGILILGLVFGELTHSVKRLWAILLLAGLWPYVMYKGLRY